MHLIDITRDVTTAEVYPGDPETRLFQVAKIGEDSDCNLTAMYACTHAGTHADAPLHFLEGGASVEQYDPEIFVGPCVVVEADDLMVTGEFINEAFPKNAERILVKGEAPFMDAAAEEAAALPNLKLIGTDGQSIGMHGGQIRPHKAFLSKGIAILEGLDLTDVEPGNYFLLALPMKIGGADGAPVRALLADDYIFWTQKR